MNPSESVSAYSTKDYKLRKIIRNKISKPLQHSFITDDSPHADVDVHDLFARLDQVREHERKRLAREIHDDLGQKLTLLRYEVLLLGMNGKDRLCAMPEVSRLLLQQVDEAIHALRTIVSDLRPAVLDLGLVAGIEWLAQTFRRQTAVSIRLCIHCPEITLNDDRTTTIFRIVQESLTNVIRHAQASQIDLIMDMHENCVHIAVTDNGIGMPARAMAKANSTGIAGMRERVRLLDGEFSIASQPGKGTTLKFKIPLCERRSRRQN